MVQPISREEERSRQTDSVFAERQEELEAMADKMPKRIAGQFPFLMERRTGVVHPYTDAMAERSDLVVGCYNLEGSRNPDDADPYYNPQAVAMRNERLKRVADLPPVSVADQKAAVAEEVGRARREERERLVAQFDADMEKERERIREEERQRLLAEMAAPAPAPAPATTEAVAPATTEAAAPAPKKPKKPKKGDAETEAKQEEAAPAKQGEDAAAGDADLNDLSAAFQKAME